MTSIFRFWVTTVTVFRLRVLGRRRRLGLSTQLRAEVDEALPAVTPAAETDVLFHELDGAEDVVLLLLDETQIPARRRMLRVPPFGRDSRVPSP